MRDDSFDSLNTSRRHITALYDFISHGLLGKHVIFLLHHELPRVALADSSIRTGAGWRSQRCLPDVHLNTTLLLVTINFCEA